MNPVIPLSHLGSWMVVPRVAGISFCKDAKSCKFDTMAKEKKKREEKYDTKLAINGSFADVIKISVTPKPKK